MYKYVVNGHWALKGKTQNMLWIWHFVHWHDWDTFSFVCHKPPKHHVNIYKLYITMIRTFCPSQISKAEHCSHFLKNIWGGVNLLISHIKIMIQRKIISFNFQCQCQYNEDISYSLSHNYVSQSYFKIIKKYIVPMTISFSAYHHCMLQQYMNQKSSLYVIIYIRYQAFSIFVTHTKSLTPRKMAVSPLWRQIKVHNARNGILLYHCDAWFYIVLLTIYHYSIVAITYNALHRVAFPGFCKVWVLAVDNLNFKTYTSTEAICEFTPSWVG